MGAMTLSSADRARIAEAIARAEAGHRGEIVVHVEPRNYRDPLLRAAALFRKLGVDRTAEDTGVLLYVATASRQAAVWAGSGVRGDADPATWQPVFAALGTGGDQVAGICAAIAALGAILAERAAGPDRHGNELADGGPEGGS